jgi:hypothetical protein
VRTVGGVDVVADKTRSADFCAAGHHLPNAVDQQGIPRLHQMTGLKRPARGARGARLGRHQNGSPRDSSKKWWLTAICSETRQGRRLARAVYQCEWRRCLRSRRSGSGGVDRAENSRLDRDALDRESDAVGDLTASSAWVFHSCALPGPAVAEGFAAAGPLAVLVAAVSAAIGG